MKTKIVIFPPQRNINNHVTVTSFLCSLSVQFYLHHDIHFSISDLLTHDVQLTDAHQMYSQEWSLFWNAVWHTWHAEKHWSPSDAHRSSDFICTPKPYHTHKSPEYHFSMTMQWVMCAVYCLIMCLVSPSALLLPTISLLNVSLKKQIWCLDQQSTSQ